MWKMNLLVFSLLVYFGIGFGLVVASHNDTYNKSVKQVVKVIDKIEVGVGGKHSSENNLYLIAQVGKNRPFEILVTPAAYATSVIGNDYVFELKPSTFAPDDSKIDYMRWLVAWIFLTFFTAIIVVFHQILDGIP